MEGRDSGLEISGLKDFRRDLKRLEPEADKELQRELKQGATKVANTARATARTFKRSGSYARSIRTFNAKGGVSIGSRLPQAGVLHWGGTISPRGVPIEFPRRSVVYDAAEAQMEDLYDQAANAVQRAAKRAGFKT